MVAYLVDVTKYAWRNQNDVIIGYPKYALSRLPTNPIYSFYMQYSSAKSREKIRTENHSCP